MIDAEGWIDVTVTLQNGMVNWPGDPSFNNTFFSSVKKDEVNISSFSTCSHIGTHIDAPLHYLENGNDVTAIPLDSLIGSAKIISIYNSREITVEDLLHHNINKGDRILFKTNNSLSEWIMKPFNESFIALTTEAAVYLKAKDVKLIGIDYLSISQIDNAKEVHELLLSSGMVILEGLDLRFADAGNYEIICLPLKIKGAEGSPARVLIKPVIKS